jgi:hypothetical protein
MPFPSSLQATRGKPRSRPVTISVTVAGGIVLVLRDLLNAEGPVLDNAQSVQHRDLGGLDRIVLRQRLQR